MLDVAKLGVAGRAVPRFTDDVDIVSSEAKTIVTVEKQAVASRLAQARWWDRARCIMVCSLGFPTMSTREFVRKLVETLRLPVVIFADGDVGGVQLALTFAHGAISTALETPWLTCTDLRWAGVHPSDFDRHFGIADQIKLGERDRIKARELIDHPSRSFVNQRVRDELSILVDRRYKVEIDSLFRDESRVFDYLQHKLEGDLIQL
jgi:meiotic recombination protein SPO11